MPRPKLAPDTPSAAGGKRKVMVYIPAGLHRAVRMVALDEGRSASDIYVEAAEAFVAARGIELAGEPAPSRTAAAVSATTDDIAGLVDALGRRIEAVLEQAVERITPPSTDDSLPPAGMKTAAAMTAILQNLRKAGAEGVSVDEMQRAMRAADIRSGTSEQARAVLRAAGLIRYEKRRWYLAAG